MLKGPRSPNTWWHAKRALTIKFPLWRKMNKWLLHMCFVITDLWWKRVLRLSDLLCYHSSHSQQMISHRQLTTWRLAASVTSRARSHAVLQALTTFTWCYCLYSPPCLITSAGTTLELICLVITSSNHNLTVNQLYIYSNSKTKCTFLNSILESC